MRARLLGIRPQYQKAIGLLLVLASVLSILVLFALRLNFVYEPRYLLAISNTIFTGIIPIAVAFLAARTYLKMGSGLLTVLFMGCGMLGFGLCAVSAGWFRHLQDGANINVTIYNTGALLGSLCHVAGALATSSRRLYFGEHERKMLAVMLSYAAIFVFTVLFSLAATQQIVPTFFIQGTGPTALRQIVLGLSIFLYALSSLFFITHYFRLKSDFLYWYSLCLAMLAVGLFAFCIERAVGSPIGWVGRSSNYLGTIFSVIAITAAVRSGRSWGSPLEEVISGFFMDAEANYMSLVEAASDAIISFDQRNRIILWNSGAERTLGYSKEEAIGRPLLGMLISEEHVKMITGLIETPDPMRSQNTAEIVARHKAGHFLPVEISAFGRELSNGCVSTCILRDISERRRTVEALRQARDDLEARIRERTAELLQTTNRLKQENEDHRRTEQFLRLEEARLDALVRLGRMSEASLAEISGFVLEQGIALTRSRIGFVGFLNEDESLYTLHAVSKDVVRECNVTGDPVKWHVAGAGLWADAIRERKTLFVNDYSKHYPGKKGLPVGHPLVHRFMVVPVLEGKRILALAGVGNKASDYDKSDERQLLLLLGGMLNHLQRKRWSEALQEAHDELELKVKRRTAELLALNAALQEEITQHKQTEDELKKTQEQLHRINESLGDQVHIRTRELKEQARQLRQLALELTLAEERERRRIAEVLHDELQQLLVGAKINLEVLFPSIELDQREDVGKVLELIMKSLRMSRMLITQLSTSALYRQGLVQALQWLGNDMRENYGLNVELQLDSRIVISREDFKVLLYQCVRELLLNAIKHARVNTVSLSMTVDDSKNLCIVVRDEGVGFDIESIGIPEAQHKGFGLFSVRERVALVGGRFETVSAPGMGTTCRLTVPVRENNLVSIEIEKVSQER